MTRTIDNEKTQVCCKYNDLTSTIQMNKGGYNPTIKCMCPSLLAAPQSFEGRKLYPSNVASLHNPFQVANCACTTSNSLLKILQDGNCPCRPLQTSTSQCGALTAPAELLQGHKLHLQNLPVFTSLCAGVNCTCLCGKIIALAVTITAFRRLCGKVTALVEHLQTFKSTCGVTAKPTEII